MSSEVNGVMISKRISSVEYILFLYVWLTCVWYQSVQFPNNVMLWLVTYTTVPLLDRFISIHRLKYDYTRQLPMGAGYCPWGGDTDRIVCNAHRSIGCSSGGHFMRTHGQTESQTIIMDCICVHVAHRLIFPGKVTLYETSTRFREVLRSFMRSHGNGKFGWPIGFELKFGLTWDSVLFHEILRDFTILIEELAYRT